MLPEFIGAPFGQRKPEFLLWAAICKASDATSYVELGTGHAHYMKAMGIEKVVAVDITTPSNGTPSKDVIYLHGDTHDVDTLKRVVDTIGDMPDIVFIDADHDGDAPQRDFDLWWTVARKLVAFHDINIPNVARVWREIAFHHTSAEIVGRDLASAVAWQGPGTSPDGYISGGGIGVLWK